MTHGTRIVLWLIGELAIVLHADEPDIVKRRLLARNQHHPHPAVTELLLNWLDPFITATELDKMMAWHLEVSLGTLLGDAGG